MPRKLIIDHYLCPGDVIVMSAALRDLHLCYPGEFITDVRTACSDIWLHNPYITALNENDPDVEYIRLHYPDIDRTNTRPGHFVTGYIDVLNRMLGLNIRATAFKGDIHISGDEKAWFEQVSDIGGAVPKFWIMSAGGKMDVTIKWWPPERYQQVVDHFRGAIEFVQIGEDGHHHPAIDGVIDLRGATTLRQLICLMYHAEGVLTPVSMPMHLAAAVETKPGAPKNRPCVVVAGGREPPHWEAYPHHQYIHTVGMLRCCDTGGCWRNRTVPVGDGDERDNPDNLCVDVVNNYPRCMQMITPEDVIRRIEGYYNGGVLSYADV